MNYLFAFILTSCVCSVHAAHRHDALSYAENVEGHDSLMQGLQEVQHYLNQSEAITYQKDDREKVQFLVDYHGPSVCSRQGISCERGSGQKKSAAHEYIHPGEVFFQACVDYIYAFGYAHFQHDVSKEMRGVVESLYTIHEDWTTRILSLDVVMAVMLGFSDIHGFSDFCRYFSKAENRGSLYAEFGERQSMIEREAQLGHLMQLKHFTLNSVYDSEKGRLRTQIEGCVTAYWAISISSESGTKSLYNLWKTQLTMLSMAVA